MTLQIGGLMGPRDGPLSMLGCNDLNARIFGDYYGVTEDPAAGSANGCLAGYLIKHQDLNKGMRSNGLLCSTCVPNKAKPRLK